MERSFTLVPLSLIAASLFQTFPQYVLYGKHPDGITCGSGAAFAIEWSSSGNHPASKSGYDQFFDAKPGENYLVEGIVILVGTVTTLMYFYFGAKFENGKPIEGRLGGDQLPKSVRFSFL